MSHVCVEIVIELSIMDRELKESDIVIELSIMDGTTSVQHADCWISL